jgi:hypothetical protein
MRWFEGERVFKWSNRHRGDDKASPISPAASRQRPLTTVCLAVEAALTWALVRA